MGERERIRREGKLLHCKKENRQVERESERDREREREKEKKKERT